MFAFFSRSCQDVHRRPSVRESKKSHLLRKKRRKKQERKPKRTLSTKSTIDDKSRMVRRSLRSSGRESYFYSSMCEDRVQDVNVIEDEADCFNVSYRQGRKLSDLVAPMVPQEHLEEGLYKLPPIKKIIEAHIEAYFRKTLFDEGSELFEEEEEEAPLEEEEEEAQEEEEETKEANYVIFRDEARSRLTAKQLQRALKTNLEKGVSPPLVVKVSVPVDIDDQLLAIMAMKRERGNELRSATKGYGLVLGSESTSDEPESIVLEPEDEPHWAKIIRCQIERGFPEELNDSIFHDLHFLFQREDMMASFDVHNDSHGTRTQADLTWSCTILLKIERRGPIASGDAVGRFVVLGTDPVSYVEPGDGFLFQGCKFAHRTIPKTTGVALVKMTIFWARNIRGTTRQTTAETTNTTEPTTPSRQRPASVALPTPATERSNKKPRPRRD